MVILSKNPIYSVLFLIFSFCNASILLFLLQLDFLPIAFLIVYVGAVAVLFLFVLMMLNIKIAELRMESFTFMPLALLLLIAFTVELICLIRLDITPQVLIGSSQVSLLSDCTLNYFFIPKSSLQYLNDYNLRSIGQLLFVNYFMHFIVSGYALLLAMLGAIVLTLYKKFICKSQNIFSQVLRGFNESITHYS